MSVNLHQPTRRQVLLGAGVLFAWAHLPKLALAENRDPRLLVVVLRGALDGLAAVAPVGDPNWLRLRGDHALRLDGSIRAVPLNNFFALHPAMPNLYRLYQAGQATIVHAAATPYRARSHFDGQDVLESGYPEPGHIATGWLNRALAALEPAGQVAARGGSALAVGPVTPLVVRGPAPIQSWTPSRLPVASDDSILRLLDLYRHTDPALARVIESQIGLAAIVGAGPMEKPRDNDPKAPLIGPARVRAFFAETAGAAARLMAQPNGPRVGALGYEGWDTHADEGPIDGRLAALLGALDGALAAAESAMGDAWRETVIAVITEFGRTALINGTQGTDHGTATVALLVGGALKGGRVIADWPGVREADLFQGRDLKPTVDLRAVLKGVLRDHLRAGDDALASRIFPGSSSVKPLPGLVVTS
jgi:uncharacterized protein (DUF1501 family)